MRYIRPDEGPYLDALAAEVKRLRQEAGLSRADLAWASEVSERMLQHVERATRRPRYRTLQRLALTLAAAHRVNTPELIERLKDLAGPALAPPKGALDKTPYVPGRRPVLDEHTGELIGWTRALKVNS